MNKEYTVRKRMIFYFISRKIQKGIVILAEV
jgi:hypothetical protein